MKAVILCEGNDGLRSIKPGDEYVGDSEWLRRKLINGLATPLDDEAKTVVANAAQIDRYADQSLVAVARELKIREEDIPSANKFPKG